MIEHQGLPVKGYVPQTEQKVAMVNRNKEAEERLLRELDRLIHVPGVDGRWLSIARTQIEQGFMAMNRAIFQPQRIELPDDRPSQTT